MKKIINAKLREQINVAVELDVDWSVDWLVASRKIENAKRDLTARLKNAMHNKISELTLEDIEFQTIDSK